MFSTTTWTVPLSQRPPTAKLPPLERLVLQVRPQVFHNHAEVLRVLLRQDQYLPLVLREVEAEVAGGLGLQPD